MESIIFFATTVFPAFASVVVITATLAYFYIKLRSRFPVKVNCWFCNNWTKVHYNNRNSFDCPTCLQYNGFNEDGTYNKCIPELYEQSTANIVYTQRTKKNKPPSNNLCSTCNYNAYLKVNQLANYEPLTEANYDVEIEHFKRQLDKTYNLCSKCNRMLQSTLLKQNTSILHKLKLKGISLMDINKTLYKKERMIFLMNFLLLALPLGLLLVVLSSVQYSNFNVRKYLPKFCFIFFKDFESKLTMFDQLDAFWKNVNYVTNVFSSFFDSLKQLVFSNSIFNVLRKYLNFSQVYFISAFIVIGILLQCLLSFWNYCGKKSVFLWVLLLTITNQRINHIEYYTTVSKISLLTLILYFNYNAMSSLKTKYGRHPKNKKDTRSSSQPSNNYFDLSDEEPVNQLKYTKTSSFKPIIQSSPADTSTPPEFTNNLSRSPTNTASTDLNLSSSDLNDSLSNLFLGKKERQSGFRPVISPSKLTNDSWIAGGFWEKSRSPDFGSQMNGNRWSLPASRNGSVAEGDNFSVLSEPISRREKSFNVMENSWHEFSSNGLFVNGKKNGALFGTNGGFSCSKIPVDNAKSETFCKDVLGNNGVYFVVNKNYVPRFTGKKRTEMLQNSNNGTFVRSFYL